MPRLIDADALKAIFDDNPFEISCQDVANIIDEQPTIGLSEQAKRDIVTIIENETDMRVIAERKHGKWELVGSTTMGDPFGELAWGKMYRCSECGFARNVIKDSEHYKFCPNCGARMDE